MKKYQKGFAPIIILLIVILLAGGIYLAVKSGKIPVGIKSVATSPIPSSAKPIIINHVDGPKDWKIYTNVDYGYSIEYPGEISSYGDSKNHFFCVDTNCEHISQLVPALWIRIAESNNPYASVSEDVCVKVEKQKIIVDNVEGYQYQRNASESADCVKQGYFSTVEILLQKNNKFFDLIALKDNWKEISEMLPTFKFTQ